MGDTLGAPHASFATHCMPRVCLVSSVVGIWFDHVHGSNTKPTRIVNTPHLVSSSVRGTLVVYLYCI